MAKFTSGQKLFPICPEEAEDSDIGKLTDYPIGIDWATLFKWYFRVKTWKAEFSYNFTASGSTADVSASISVPSPIDVITTTNIDSESNFTCTTPFISGVLPSIYEYQEDTSDDGFVSAVINTLGPPTITLFGTKILYKDGLFYPFYRIGLSTQAIVGGTSGDGNIDTQAILFSAPNVSGTIPIDIAIEIDGEVGALQWSYAKSVFNEGDASSDVSLNITNLKLTPEEYWTYDDYYDGTTGDILIDPWSYQP